MRSRYCAYVLRCEDYLLATWHPDTRPARLGLADEAPAPTWLGLKIVDRRETGPGQAEVEFVARSRVGGGRAQRLHERSRFRQIDGRWYYLDGVFPDAEAS